MFSYLLQKIIGTANQRMLNAMRPVVQQVNALEVELSALEDKDFPREIDALSERAIAGESLDKLLPRTFALVREASKRVLGLRHFDEQILGGIVLHQGKISEMKTGEGKTLVATLPVVLNALMKKGVHLVTVNDYLARRDAEWMGAIYNFLGLSVGCILSGMEDSERRAQYHADITYATNNELGFDYLRDNLKLSLEDCAQRDYHFAIVDEVDSILIDEARTPLIISGPAEDDPEIYRQIAKLVPQLSKESYEIDEKLRNITLTEAGAEAVEGLVSKAGLMQEGNLYDMQNISLLHHVNQALKAEHLFEREVHYIIEDGNIVIIDEFTGRKMASRRYSDGLHQAIEAKEKVTVQNESQTIASITFQNYFRMYDKLSGMTGTAATEAEEFGEIYSLEVVELPTHVSVTRIDYDDEIYRLGSERDDAVLGQIQECNKKGQPVLVGTVSIEKSESLSAKLKKAKITHNVLNAKQNEKEAEIVAEAGRLGSVTIATNMAGRGTDIQLGGNLDMKLQLLAATRGAPIESAEADKMAQTIKGERGKVLEAGGLFIIGTERHENRRIDNQLRGRAGRQGDVGASKFFLSLEDDLMRIFGSERMSSMLAKLGIEEGEAISHIWISKAIERAQKKVEAHHFDIRKQLLKFDNVMNDQRNAIFKQRRDIMSSDDIHDITENITEELTDYHVSNAIPERAHHSQWQLDALHAEILRIFGLNLPVQDWGKQDGIAEQEIKQKILEQVHLRYSARQAHYGEGLMKMAEKSFMLQVIDAMWKDHLHQLDHLRQGIGLRAYGQRDPLNEYRQEAFTLFEDMLSRIHEHFIQLYALADFTVETAQPQRQMPIQNRQYSSKDAQDGGLDPNNPETWGRVPRNAPCPCGTGKKYKHCHGRV